MRAVSAGVLLIASLLAPLSRGGAVHAGHTGGTAGLDLRGAQRAAVAGCWELTMMLGMFGPVRGRLQLTEGNGAALTGVFTGPRGRSEPLRDGAVLGSRISFALQGPHGLLHFEGVVEGAGMHGVARPSRPGQAPRPGGFGLPWHAERCP